MMSARAALKIGSVLAVLAALIAAPARAGELPVRIDYEDGRLSVEARDVPVGAVLMLAGQKLGFEVVDMGASGAPVEEIWIQEQPLDRALSKLLERTSYAIQYAPDTQKGHRIERIIVMGGGDLKPPGPDVAERVPEITPMPVPDGERPPGLTPEQAEQWPELASRIDKVLQNVYGQEPAEPPIAGLTPEKVFSEQQLEMMEILPDSHLDAPPPDYIPVEPGEVFSPQALQTLEMLRAWQQGQPPAETLSTQ